MVLYCYYFVFMFTFFLVWDDVHFAAIWMEYALSFLASFAFTHCIKWCNGGQSVKNMNKCDTQLFSILQRFFSVLWSHFSGAYKHPSLCWMSVVVVLSSKKRKSSLHFIFSPSLIVIRCEKHCDAALQMTFPSKTELAFQATTTATISNIINRKQ